MPTELQNIEQILKFTIEIERLKNITRKTRPVGLDRYENSAEHSWHVCLSALMLKEYANEDINIDRVIKMLLIHDLGEIDAGDTIVYNAESEEIKRKEAEGVERVLKLLPEQECERYTKLWHEFESSETADAKFAKAIDRIPPLLHNLHGEGHSWRDNKITAENIFSVNSRIANGSEVLWKIMKAKIENAIEDGILEE